MAVHAPAQNQMLQPPAQPGGGHQTALYQDPGAAASYYQLTAQEMSLAPDAQQAPLQHNGSAAASGATMAPVTPPLRPHSVPYSNGPSTTHKSSHDPSAQGQSNDQDLPTQYHLATEPGTCNIAVKCNLAGQSTSSSGASEAKTLYTVMPARDQTASPNGLVPNILYYHSPSGGPGGAAPSTMVGKILAFDTTVKEVDLEIHGDQKVFPLHDVQGNGMLVGRHELGRLEWEDGIVGTFVDEGYGGKIGILEVHAWEDGQRDASLTLHNAPESRIWLDELVLALLATLAFQKLYSSTYPPGSASSPNLSAISSNAATNNATLSPDSPNPNPSPSPSRSRSSSSAGASRSLFGGSSSASKNPSKRRSQAKALAAEIKLGASAALDTSNKIRSRASSPGLSAGGAGGAGAGYAYGADASTARGERKGQAKAIAKDIKSGVSAYRARRREQKQGEQVQAFVDGQDWAQQVQDGGAYGGDPTGGMGDPTGGMGDPTGGMAQSMGDPTGGMGDPTGGMGDPTGGMGDPTGGMGDPTGGAAEAAGGDGGEGVSEIVEAVAAIASAGLV